MRAASGGGRGGAGGELAVIGTVADENKSRDSMVSGVMQWSKKEKPHQCRV
jgi:hypothetical protein